MNASLRAPTRTPDQTNPPRPAAELLRAGIARRRRRRMIVISALVLLTLALFGAAVAAGERSYGLDQIVRVVLGEQVPGASFAIGTLRLPRAVTGVLVGIAFGIAGTIFQTMLRNPLASPDIIGITSGSSAAAVFAILVLGTTGPLVSIIALTCGIGVAAAIYLLSRRGDATGGRLILIGIGVGAMLDSVISYLLLTANEYDVPAAMRWLTGSLNLSSWQTLQPLLVALIVLVPLTLIVDHELRALELGVDTAIALGVRVDLIRIALILCAVALASFATATTGPIAFVAFLAGPIALRLTGSGDSTVVPSALVGATLVLGADLLGQFAFDTKFPVGVITGILGAPYLLYLLIRMNRSGGAQ